MFELFSTLKLIKKIPLIPSKLFSYFTTNTTSFHSSHLEADTDPPYYPTNYQNFNTAILKANLNKTLTYPYYQRPILK
jgi:hypothetical protein